MSTHTTRRPPQPAVSITNIELKSCDDDDSLLADNIDNLKDTLSERDNIHWYAIPPRGEPGGFWTMLLGTNDLIYELYVGAEHDEVLFLMRSDVLLFLHRLQKRLWFYHLTSCGTTFGQLRTDKKVDGKYIEIEICIKMKSGRKPGALDDNGIIAPGSYSLSGPDNGPGPNQPNQPSQLNQLNQLNQPNQPQPPLVNGQ